MKDNNFDPNLLKQVAGAMAQSFTEHSGEKARDKKMVSELSSKLDTAQTVICDNCSHHVFQAGIVLKRFSAINSPTGQEVVVPIELFCCTKCGHVNSEFLPSYAISDIKKFDENGLPTY
jgi:rubrerythrin